METASEWGSNTCPQTESETEMHFDITCIQIIPKTYKKKENNKQTAYKIKKKIMFTSGFEPTFSSLLFKKVSL